MSLLFAASGLFSRTIISIIIGTNFWKLLVIIVRETCGPAASYKLFLFTYLTK